MASLAAACEPVTRVFMETNRTRRWVHNGQRCTMSEHHSSGAAVTILDRTPSDPGIHCYSTGLPPLAAATAMSVAQQLAGAMPGAPVALPSWDWASRSGVDTNLCDPLFWPTPDRDREALVLTAVDEAQSLDVRVLQAVYGETVRVVGLIDSVGRQARYALTHCYLSCSVCSDGIKMRGAGHHAASARAPARLQARECAARAAAIARALTDPAPPSPGRYHVILGHAAASALAWAVARALSATAVASGQSFLTDWYEQPWASPALTIWDDPTLCDGIMSGPVDGEGTLTACRLLIDRGRPVGLLRGRRDPLPWGPCPAGSTRCSTYRDRPTVNPSNLVIGATATDPPVSDLPVLTLFDITPAGQCVGLDGQLAGAARGTWACGGSAQAFTGLRLHGHIRSWLGLSCAPLSHATWTYSPGPTLTPMISVGPCTFDGNTLRPEAA